MKRFWLNFLRRCALQANEGSLRTGERLEFAWVNSALPINNATWCTTPPVSVADLRERIVEAGSSTLPWVFYLFEPEVPATVLAEADAVASAGGLTMMGYLRVMLGDVAQLLPPARQLPAVQMVRVASRADAWNALDLNTRAYGMPLFITDSVVDSGAYFRDAQREFGFVAMAGGVPVSTATVIEIDGWLYVAAVATCPGHRKQGYAEAVMRHALQTAADARGITRTALDASLGGSTLYAQMGYKATGDLWRMYVSA